MKFKLPFQLLYIFAKLWLDDLLPQNN